MKMSVLKSIRIPPNIAEEVEKIAARDKQSVNLTILTLLVKGIQHDKTTKK